MLNFCKSSLLLPILLVLLITPVYLFRLSSIPQNITGDEIGYISAIHQIFYSPTGVSPLDLLGDGSQPATNFYWMAIWTKIAGIPQVVFGMRLSTVIWSLLLLVVFYYILKKRTSSIVSFFTTSLMATNLWYLNFTRNGWFNLGALFWGLLMIYFLEKGQEEGKLRWYGVAGLFAAIASYGYFAGKIYPLAALIYLSLIVAINKFSLQKIKALTLFSLTTLTLLIPLFATINTHQDKFFQRPTAVFIFNSQQDVLSVFTNQATKIVQGLIFLDGSVVGKGIENLRYHPPQTSVVDPFIRVLFILGLVIAISLRFKIALWWITYFLSLLILGTLTIDAPNLARTVTIIPFIYLIVGLTLHEAIKRVPSNFSIKVIVISLVIITLSVAYFNVSHYFSWASSREVSEARQPALSYEEFPTWQRHEINLIKTEQSPITLQQWWQIQAEDSLP